MSYTLAVTSCARHDLLRITLDSFIEHADVLPIETIIIEDGSTPRPDWLTEQAYPQLGKLTWLQNGIRHGQWFSVDRVCAEIKTEWFFQLEDDWFIERGPFIQPSFDILEKYPNIWTVSLRGNDCSGHPVVKDSEYPFLINQPYWRGVWGGAHWNPGARRLSDVRRVGSCGEHVGYGVPGIKPEEKLSKLHLDMGYRIATLDTKRHIHHIGAGRSRAAEKTIQKTDIPGRTPLKVLFAVFACWKFDYGSHHLDVNGLDVHNDKYANAQDNPNEAIRETWAQDLRQYPSCDFKFFYGRGATRELLSDEVSLDCPDDYHGLPHKMQAICRYALEREFDFIFKCDTDTFLFVDRLMSRCDFWKYDQYGWSPHGTGPLKPNDGNYSTGGPGYFLSRRAMQAIVQDTVVGSAEDLWVGQTIRKHGLQRYGDRRFTPGYDAHFIDVDSLGPRHDKITLHACTPATMRKLYSMPVDLPEPINERSTGEPRIFIAIKSCNRYAARRKAQRETWVPLLPEEVEYKYFVGNPAKNESECDEPDVVSLDVPDDYRSLVPKIRAMLVYAYERDYDYCFVCDDDTYVNVKNFLASDFRYHDYRGWSRNRNYCQGGAGYWLSRKAIEAIMECPSTGDSILDDIAGEDEYIGTVLSRCGITPEHDSRYQVGLYGHPSTLSKDVISVHKLSAGNLMHLVHERLGQNVAGKDADFQRV